MTIGRIYTIPLDAISVTTDADQDIWEMVMGSVRDAVLHGFSLTSDSTTDERVRLRLVRRSTSGTGGAAATEEPTHPGNTNTADVALNTLVTTPGTIGGILKGWRWSQQGELLYLPTPELRPVAVKSGNRLCLNLQSAVASTRLWSGWVAWEEI
jgi:hypothetical protein